MDVKLPVLDGTGLVRTVINIQHLEKIANSLGIEDIRELIDFTTSDS